MANNIFKDGEIFYDNFKKVFILFSCCCCCAPFKTKNIYLFGSYFFGIFIFGSMSSEEIFCFSKKNF